MAKKKVSANSSKAVSPDFVSGFYTIEPLSKKSEKKVVLPKVDLEAYTSLLEDPDVVSAVKTVIDAVLYSGYTITHRSKEETNQNALNKLLKQYRFDIVLRKALLNALIYRKAYIELVRKPMAINGDVGLVVVELHVLHTPTIRPVMNKHGDVLGYVQQIGDEIVSFKPDEICEIDLYPSTNSYWGFDDLNGLMEVVKTKQLLEAYVDYIYRNNRVVDYWKFPTSTPRDKVEEFVNNLKNAVRNPSGQLVIGGDVERYFMQNHAFLRDILEYLYYLRGKIYEFFGVPPIFAGFIEGANRSSAETQARIVFNSKVKAIKQALEYQINNDLFDKIGIRAKFTFNPYDRLEVKDRVQMSLQLKALGLSKDTIRKFLRTGYLPEDVLFADETGEVDVVEDPNSKKKIRDQTTNLTAPSRQPRDRDVRPYNTGSESTTREDQIFGK